MKNTRGFTIVELLVVIIVIGILAAISIVVYSGIQDRAENARIIAAVDAYSKSLKLYHLTHGRFPDFYESGGSQQCLGEISDYPAEGDWPAGACIYSSYFDSYGYASTTFNNELSTEVSGLPNPRIPEVRETYSSGHYTRYRGIYYEYSNSAPGAEYADWGHVEWVIRGKQECPQKFVTRYREEQDVTFCSQVIWASDGGID